MKIEENVRIRDNIPRMIRTHSWNGEEIKIELNAYEYECDMVCGDPKGDVIYNSYKSKEIKRALEDFLDVASKDYEDICLSIYNREDEAATFSIHISKGGISVWTTTNITSTDKNTEKLARIEKIIQE